MARTGGSAGPAVFGGLFLLPPALALAALAALLFPYFRALGPGPRALPPPALRNVEEEAHRPATGKFLVAAPSLQDPNFAETVVLLVEHGPEGSWGLVINREAPATLSELFPEERVLRERKEHLLLGGPVEPVRLLLLAWTDSPPRDSRPVLEDVHLVWSLSFLQGARARGIRAFRMYAGRAGWGPGQLDRELARGDWLVLPGEAALVFSEHPEQVWKTLRGKAPLSVAGGSVEPSGSVEPGGSVEPSATVVAGSPAQQGPAGPWRRPAFGT
jgi:putative transcriptional regulator